MQITTVLQTIRKQGVEEIHCKILEDLYEVGTATIKFHTETDNKPIKKVSGRATLSHQYCLHLSLRKYSISKSVESEGVNIENDLAQICVRYCSLQKVSK